MKKICIYSTKTLYTILDDGNIVVSLCVCFEAKQKTKRKVGMNGAILERGKNEDDKEVFILCWIITAHRN